MQVNDKGPPRNSNETAISSFSILSILYLWCDRSSRYKRFAANPSTWLYLATHRNWIDAKWVRISLYASINVCVCVRVAYYAQLYPFAIDSRLWFLEKSFTKKCLCLFILICHWFCLNDNDRQIWLLYLWTSNNMRVLDVCVCVFLRLFKYTH